MSKKLLSFALLTVMLCGGAGCTDNAKSTGNSGSSESIADTSRTKSDTSSESAETSPYSAAPQTVQTSEPSSVMGQAGAEDFYSASDLFPSDTYIDVRRKIEEYMNSFIGMYTFDNGIVTEDHDIFGYSSQGGVLTEYKDKDGRLVRLRLVLYGETGSSEGNYCIISETEALYTLLVKKYSSADIMNNNGDILNYTYGEYWLDGGQIFHIDSLNEQLRVCGEDPIPQCIADRLRA